MTDTEGGTRSWSDALERLDRPKLALGLSLLLLAVVLSLSAFVIVSGYRDTLARAEARAASGAHIVSAHMQWLVEASRQALRRIDASLTGGPGDQDAVTIGDLDAAVANLPPGVQVSVYDAAGNARLSSEGLEPVRNVADRDYFQALAAGEEWHISAGLIDAPSDEPVFVIALRLERDAGFTGIAAVTIQSTMLAEFWRPLDLGEGSAISIVREDGWLVARFPPIEEPLNLADYELFTEHLVGADEGAYVAERSPADGVSRVVGFRRVPNEPLVALAAVSTDATLGGYWQAVAIFLGLLLPVAAALLFGALWLARVLGRDGRRRAELSAALEQNRLLLREIHHRVKNNLQAVSSLVRLQPLATEAKEEMGRRIAAMVAVHEHIYRTDEFGDVEARPFIEKLVDSLRASSTDPIDIACDISDVRIDQDHALPIGLIVSEVVSNAVKHAFKGRGRGRVSVVLAAEDEGRARLTISDDGVGIDADTVSDGMGRRLVEGLAAQIQGSFTYRNEGGTTFELQFLRL